MAPKARHRLYYTDSSTEARRAGRAGTKRRAPGVYDATCDQFRLAAYAQVNIVLGCATVVG